MSVIVTDNGFGSDDWSHGVATLDDLDAGLDARAVELANTDDPSRLSNRLSGIALIRIAFPAFNDGRGFTLARRLRAMGYTGRLRAVGPVIADQYAMFRRTGFDEVEIPDEIAERQPQEQWQFRANWRAHDYQSRLRA
jgi:uncharacterized protein (DUF934 family)